jgi:uncharacterized protein HemY
MIYFIIIIIIMIIIIIFFVERMIKKFYKIPINRFKN